jgi:hypothetical protein
MAKTTENPFGSWTHHRARIAAMSRLDADASEMDDAQRLLRAARLADKIIAIRDELTPEERRRLARILEGKAK